MPRSRLLELLDILDRRARETVDESFDYAVPDLWNGFGYQGGELRRLPGGGLLVHPWRFYRDAIRAFILPRAQAGADWGAPLGSPDPDLRGGDWIRQASVYSMMVRTSTAWDHDRSGALEDRGRCGFKETGTFLKSIALLSHLHRMGITCIQLLPVAKRSQEGRKGELGSPYAVSDFFRLDPGLKDPMAGPDFLVEDEFGAFVEACHILGMRVLIDIIPRTQSVGSGLILDHPDWFYWIRQEALAGYRPPRVAGLGAQVRPSAESLPIVYRSAEVRRHLAAFVENPAAADPERWGRLRELLESDPERGLAGTVRELFGLAVAPAFSDQINDPQPAWDDVTFLRMYLDHPAASAGRVDPDGPPYILFDVIKADRFPGRRPNEPLWDLLAGVIPYHQERFGIDGARIDMGHALPRELVERIIRGARRVDPDFCFIAEEMEAGRAGAAREAGYNLILGDGFIQEPRVLEGRTRDFLYGARELACPVFACGETHDTPRLAAREGGRVLARMLTILNLFMPNGVPFLNSGQEVYEVQPMNTGVDCRPDEAFRLDPEDPGYGRLALFDRFALHYLDPGRWELPDQLARLSALRREHLASFTRAENCVPLGFDPPGDPGIALGFLDDRHRGRKVHEDSVFVVAAHTGLDEPRRLTVRLEALRRASGNRARTCRQLFSSHGPAREPLDFDAHCNLTARFQPGEVKIIRM